MNQVHYCPRAYTGIKLEGGLQQFHRADNIAVQWLMAHECTCQQQQQHPAFMKYQSSITSRLEVSWKTTS